MVVSSDGNGAPAVVVVDIAKWGEEGEEREVRNGEEEMGK